MIGRKRLGTFPSVSWFLGLYDLLFFEVLFCFFLFFFCLRHWFVFYFVLFFFEKKSLSFLKEEICVSYFVKSKCLFFLRNKRTTADPWNSGLCLFVTLSLFHSLALLRCCAELLGPDCTLSRPQILLRSTDRRPSLLGFPHTLLYAYTHSLILCEQTPRGHYSRVGIKTRDCPA